MEKRNIYALDWAHTENKTIFFDGERLLSKPKLQEGDIVLSENIPSKIARPLLEKHIVIKRVHPCITAEYREKHHIDKTDENDARVIYVLYQETPESFKDYIGEPVLKNLYAIFKEIQKNRVATQNRAWANGGDVNDLVLKDIGQVEKNILKQLKKELQKYPLYTYFLISVKGIDTATAAGLIASIGDIERFSMVSHLWSYLGLGVTDGKAPKKQKGEVVGFSIQKRALILGVIGSNFIRQNTPLYREIYDKEKERQAARVFEPGFLKANYKGYKDTDVCLSKGHAHNRAIRKMMKVFIQHYWYVDRRIHGLDTRVIYPLEYQEHKSFIPPPVDVDKIIISLKPRGKV